MEPTVQIQQQVERFINKIADKFPPNEESSVMTDIHIRISQESGEAQAFNDDDQEITRCVVDGWIDNKDEDFYASVVPVLRQLLEKNAAVIDNLGIIKPYSFVLEDDEKEVVSELRVCDDDTIIIDSGELMADLDEDLDAFFKNLLEN